jgi:hypothetical protein
MTERPHPPPADDDGDPPWAAAVDRELWHVRPDGSGHDRYPPFASFGPGTMPYRGGTGDDDAGTERKKTEDR